MKSIGKLNPRKCVLLICDIQERFVPLIYRSQTIVNTCRYMTSIASTLNIPMICTQQYTKHFGNTVSDCFATKDIETLATTPIYEKKKFSMITDEVKKRIFQLPDEIDTFLLLGIEAHVCLQQTCLDLLDLQRYATKTTNPPRFIPPQVHLIVDGISSQQPYDRHIALQRMQHAGAYITTAQSAAFMLMESADHEHFKTISKLSVEHMKLPNEFNSDFK